MFVHIEHTEKIFLKFQKKERSSRRNYVVLNWTMEICGSELDDTHKKKMKILHIKEGIRDGSKISTAEDQNQNYFVFRVSVRI